MTPIRIELLGKLRFSYGQQLLTSINTNRMRSLLAFLVLHGDAPQSREHLAFLLWPESSESQARTNLRQLLQSCNARTCQKGKCSFNSASRDCPRRMHGPTLRHNLPKHFAKMCSASSSCRTGMSILAFVVIARFLS